MELVQPRIPDEDPNEAKSLASELSNAYQNMSSFYRDHMRLDPSDADQAARGLDQTPEQALADLVRIREQAPDQVSWGDLQRLVNYDADELVAAWAHLKAEARDELASGHRTARALEWNGRPLDRARFLAIRDSFRETTPPQNGIESALVDTAAEAFSDFLQSTEQLHMQVSSEVASERDSLERHGSWSPARLSTAEAIEQSAKMAEHAHKRLQRCPSQSRPAASERCNGIDTREHRVERFTEIIRDQVSEKWRQHGRIWIQPVGNDRDASLHGGTAAPGRPAPRAQRLSCTWYVSHSHLGEWCVDQHQSAIRRLQRHACEVSDPRDQRGMATCSRPSFTEYVAMWLWRNTPVV